MLETHQMQSKTLKAVSDLDRLFIKTDKIELSYQISDIVKYYFIKEDDTSINSINGDANNIHFNYTDNDFLLIEGITEEDNVNVYEINGRTYPVDIVRNGNNVRVELKMLPRDKFASASRQHGTTVPSAKMPIWSRSP